ncbi:hypothetical protein [Mitsuaria sp. 7]|uniref:hypothetical protein n=1 Tax=Mitsuaria sp. 7 TaxID=1658665 RepID=UPI0007DD69AB|nr:hypothetical protein [Mitsuaria sp. 7]ANH69100.1 hypothetical protein ABE85_18775 [Mitsuaria sp. 7]
MHVKSNASSSPTAHVGAPASAGPAKAAKANNGGAPDFTRMLNDAKAAAPASATTAPMAATPAAAAPSTAAPATLSLDTASLAARG